MKNRIIPELYEYYVSVGICESINGEIVMLEGKKLRKAAKELATYSIMFPPYRDTAYNSKKGKRDIIEV